MIKLKINGKDVNGKNISMWVMSLVVAAAIGMLLTSWSGISGRALQVSEEARKVSIQNRQDIAVLNERLLNIEKKLDRIYDAVSKP